LIDVDEERFTPALLREWKQRAENSAAQALLADSRYRPIAATEVKSELSVAEMAAFKELEEEFGCHVETEVLVPAGEGLLGFTAR